MLSSENIFQIKLLVFETWTFWAWLGCPALSESFLLSLKIRWMWFKYNFKFCRVLAAVETWQMRSRVMDANVLRSPGSRLPYFVDADKETRNSHLCRVVASVQIDAKNIWDDRTVYRRIEVARGIVMKVLRILQMALVVKEVNIIKGNTCPSQCACLSRCNLIRSTVRPFVQRRNVCLNFWEGSATRVMTGTTVAQCCGHIKRNQGWDVGLMLTMVHQANKLEQED